MEGRKQERRFEKLSKKKKTVLVLAILLGVLLVTGIMSGVVNMDLIKGKEPQKPILPPPTGIIFRAANIDVNLLVELPPNTKVTSIWADFMGTGNILVGDDQGRVWLLRVMNEKERR